MEFRAMSASPYDRDLDLNAANFQPLTPLTVLERAAAVFPDRLAVAQGRLCRNDREFHARSKTLACALAKRGFVRGDTVAVVLANTPTMLEWHYGVPMCGAVLNTLNARLDAAIEWRRTRLARNKRPRHVVCAKNPKALTGKSRKFALRERARHLDAGQA
jgi:acyl-CoA synthetase (AMP-forming)/AMP-acid ligase II